MRARLAALIGALRARGVRVSVAEAIDAASAAAAVGVDRPVLADALAAALVKDEADRATFEACFAEVFPARIESASTGRRKKRVPRRGEPGGEGGGAPAGASGGGRADWPAMNDVSERGVAPQPSKAAEAASRHDDDARHGVRGVAEREGDAGRRHRGELARARELRTRPFAEMSPRDVDEAAALVRTLARQLSSRLRRRLRPRSRGRLDVRRTLRASTQTGGVPLVRRYRARRPRRPALVALCDLSVSAATATDFFLALLAPAAEHFARVRLFGYVDRLVEIEFVEGRVQPAGPIDLMARSDFGRVLQDLTTDAAGDLTTDTVLLVLGDARNNRRPPRVDLLAAARARVRRVVWLNPEAVARWNTGDSVIGLYARHVDALVACASLDELADAVVAVARR